MVVIEEIPAQDVQTSGAEMSDSDDEMPTLEPSMETETTATNSAPSKQNRSEKKCRKALSKLGLKPVSGINRVTIKKTKNVLFVIDKPEVFKNSTGETFVIFGEAKIEDLNAQNQAQAAQQFTAPEEVETKSSITEEVEEEGVVDETGVDGKDIELVMSQSSVSRAKAVKALKANDNDIVNAIMELTM